MFCAPDIRYRLGVVELCVPIVQGQLACFPAQCNPRTGGESKFGTTPRNGRRWTAAGYGCRAQ